MVAPIGPPATIDCEPRQTRKGAAAPVDTGAGHWRVGAATFISAYLPTLLARVIGILQRNHSAFNFHMTDTASSTTENTDYRVLARRWRPRDFTSIAGQEPIVDALVNGLNSGRVHHAFLFTGTRGVGKTTLARILAKCLNCEQGVTAKPCGECSACINIDEGRFVDLLEVDAASRTKVEDTRELLDNVQYAPTRGRYKVYLIDEVHMLSTSSFNALLKTLEEPPPHVKFILATTDPQKIPVTILSRCLRFNLRRLEADRIFSYLSEQLSQESVNFEPTALHAIARAADGSMRDSLSLLDQALAHGSGELKHDAVGQMLGMVEDRLIEQLIEGLRDTSIESLLNTVSEIYARGQSVNRSLQQLALTLHQIAILQQYPSFETDTQANSVWLREISQQLHAEDVQLFYQIAVTGRKELSLAPDPRVGFEMTLLRMLAFKPVSEVKEPVATPIAPVTNQSHAPAAAPSKVSKPISEPDKVVAPSVIVDDSTTMVTKAKPTEEPDIMSVQAAATVTVDSIEDTAAPEPKTAEPESHKPKIEFSSGHWLQQFSKLELKGAARIFGEHLMLAEVTSAQDMFIFKMHQNDKHMHTASTEKNLSSALARQVGRPVRTKIQYVESEIETPSKQFQTTQDSAHQQAQLSIETDSVVNTIIDTFDAKIAPGSIKPANLQPPN